MPFYEKDGNCAKCGKFEKKLSLTYGAGFYCHYCLWDAREHA